jgi:hypothetical protein
VDRPRRNFQLLRKLGKEVLVDGLRPLGEGRRGLAQVEIEDDGEKDAKAHKKLKEKGDSAPPLLYPFRTAFLSYG